MWPGWHYIFPTQASFKALRDSELRSIPECTEISLPIPRFQTFRTFSTVSMPSLMVLGRSNLSSYGLRDRGAPRQPPWAGSAARFRSSPFALCSLPCAFILLLSHLLQPVDILLLRSHDFCSFLFTPPNIQDLPIYQCIYNLGISRVRKYLISCYCYDGRKEPLQQSASLIKLNIF